MIARNKNGSSYRYQIRNMNLWQEKEIRLLNAGS